MSFKELLVSKDKCTSIISRQMEAIVFIILCNIFAARRTKCSRKVYLPLTGMFTFQCSLVRLHKQTNMSLLCKNTKTLSYLEFYSTIGTHLKNIIRFSFVFGGAYQVPWRFETKRTLAKIFHGLQFTTIHQCGGGWWWIFTGPLATDTEVNSCFSIFRRLLAIYNPLI